MSPKDQQEFSQLFRKEILLLSQLNHPSTPFPLLSALLRSSVSLWFSVQPVQCCVLYPYLYLYM